LLKEHYRTFKRKIASAKTEKICWQITVAALMQPLQYYLRDPTAKDKSITHAAAAPSNLDAATTTLFAASRRKHAHIYAHGKTKWQQSCSHSTAICNNRFKTRMELRTQEQPLVAEHRGGTNSRMKRPQPRPPHTRGTFHRRLQPLYTEKHKVLCSGFLPKTKPIEHSFSHYNAFRSITSLRHHFPSSPLPKVTTLPSSPIPKVTTSLRHHFPSSPLPFIAFYSFVMYCYTEPPFIAFHSFVMYCYTEPPFIAFYSFVMYCYG